MDASDHDPIMPATLLAEIEAVAARESRSSRDVLRDAVELYLRERRPSESELRRAREAADRMLARRHEHRVAEGESIKSLMTYGRM